MKPNNRKNRQNDRKMPSTTNNLKNRSRFQQGKLSLKCTYTDKEDKLRSRKVHRSNLERFQDTRMSSSLEEENQIASCEMEEHNLQEKQNQRNGDLAQSLRRMISKPVKELIADYRAKKKQDGSGNVLRPKPLVSTQRPEDADVLAPLARKQERRKRKNPVVGEKVVWFSLPEDCDVESIEDIDKVNERLGTWKIQRRQRRTKLVDTYYCHLRSKLTFRSLNEAVNFIIFESIPPHLNQKRKKVKNVIFESHLKMVEEHKANKEDVSKDTVEISRDPNNVEQETEEAHLLTEASQEKQKEKEQYSGEVGTILQENNLKDDTDDDIYNQLQDITTDWKSNYRISEAYCFGEYDMWNKISIDDDVPDLVEVRLNKKKENIV